MRLPSLSLAAAALAYARLPRGADAAASAPLLGGQYEPTTDVEYV